MRKLLFLLSFTIFIFSCAPVKQSATYSTVPKLKFLNTIEIPFDTQFQNTTIGGLSGIDYDPTQDLYYIICDDRSVFNEARYYTATIAIENNLLKNVSFQSVQTLKNDSGKAFGNWNNAPINSTDPEDIRFHAKTNTLVWSSEGARVMTADKKIIQNPALNFMTLKGDFLGIVTLPENLKMQKLEKGPRNNGTLEGITFDHNFKKIYANIEEPLFEDGNQATTSKGGLIRLYLFNTKTGKNTAQYGYLLEPIAREPNPSGAFAVNGISAIQYYSKHKLLVVERSYSTGTQECTVKVFMCDLKKTTNVKKNSTLLNQNIKVGSKKLVLNMDDLGIFIDNIEGITFGPRLPSGNRSLVLVSDNNFAEKQKTQFLLFEVLEEEI